MVALPKDLPQTITIEEHMRIVREKDQKIHKLEKQLRFREELDAVPAEVLSQAQKAALNVALKAYQEEGPLLKETDKLAQSVGMSTKTFQKHLTYFDDNMGIIEKEIKAIRDKDTGGVKFIETRIKPNERAFYPRLYEAKDRNHGGKRMYCKCGSSRIKPNTTYTCMDCGEVHAKPPHFHPPIPPDDQFGNQVPKQETENDDSSPDSEATIIDSYLVPDDQLGNQVSANLTTNLALESPNYLLNQVGIQVLQDDSINPPPTVSSPADHVNTIKRWLEGRRGTSIIIQATGSLDTADKYKTKPSTFEPDLEAFITGKIGHIYGSRLRNPETGLTNVLCFEIDQAKYNDQAPNYLYTLARAGAAPVYWQRQRQRGHLEIYFSHLVDAEAARLWALEVCPDLEDIPEVYPCQGKANNALSWPLYQRIGGQVYPCRALVMLPAPHDGTLQEIDPTDLEALAGLITVATTPAALVVEHSARVAQLEEQKREQDEKPRGGGVNGISPSPITQVGNDRDLAKQAVADFNRTHRIEDMVDVQGGKFLASWRGERTPSVALDRDGEHATDYGRNGNFPKKLDAYEVYCLINGIDKKADLAERCTQLRRQEIKLVEPEREVVALFPVDQKPAELRYVPCIICRKPKSIKRADGAYICGTDHSRD